LIFWDKNEIITHFPVKAKKLETLYFERFQAFYNLQLSKTNFIIGLVYLSIISIGYPVDFVSFFFAFGSKGSKSGLQAPV
jgi:hypothetical protein